MDIKIDIIEHWIYMTPRRSVYRGDFKPARWDLVRGWSYKIPQQAAQQVKEGE